MVSISEPPSCASYSIVTVDNVASSSFIDSRAAVITNRLSSSESFRGVPSEPAVILSYTWYKITTAPGNCAVACTAKRAAFLEVSEKSVGTKNFFISQMFFERYNKGLISYIKSEIGLQKNDCK